MIDLQKTSRELVWGDGTPYPEKFNRFIYENSERNMYISGEGIQSHEGDKWYFLCQGHNGDQVW